jgi:hypothetical protein
MCETKTVNVFVIYGFSQIKHSRILFAIRKGFVIYYFAAIVLFFNKSTCCTTSQMQHGSPQKVIMKLLRTACKKVIRLFYGLLL